MVHILAGVGSSSSKAKAEAFLDEINAPATCGTFANYSTLVQNPQIDVVYIATPHAYHFQNAMMALYSGKHVLCEKPLTVNAEQAKRLFAVAAQNHLFLMEGMWTRFQPIGVEVRRLLEQSAVGTITRISADNGLGMIPSEQFPPEDRLIRKDLAGGALLDCKSIPRYQESRVRLTNKDSGAVFTAVVNASSAEGKAAPIRSFICCFKVL